MQTTRYFFSLILEKIGHKSQGTYFRFFFFLAESEHVASRKHSVSYLAPHVFLQIKQSKRKYVEETEDHEQEGIREELLTA